MPICRSALLPGGAHFGVLVARDARRRAERLRRLTLIERHFSALPIDDAVARSYGQLAAAVTAFGRQPRARVMDLLIAATARTHGAVLYTWNPGDLTGLDELVDVRTQLLEQARQPAIRERLTAGLTGRAVLQRRVGERHLAHGVTANRARVTSASVYA